MSIVDDGMFYLAGYTDSKTLKALTALQDLTLDRKRHKPADMRKQIKNLLR